MSLVGVLILFSDVDGHGVVGENQGVVATD